MFLQDGDPSQNRKMSQESLTDYLGDPLGLLIENIFRLVGTWLRKDATKKKIKRGTYKYFCIRVTNTLHNFPSDIMDQTTASMTKRIDAVIKMKGQRTKY